ncbi:hypothetical protein EON67_10355, partial [archaeon]
MSVWCCAAPLPERVFKRVEMAAHAASHAATDRVGIRLPLWLAAAAGFSAGCAITLAAVMRMRSASARAADGVALRHDATDTLSPPSATSRGRGGGASSSADNTLASAHPGAAGSGVAGDTDELRAEQFSRNRQFLGDAGQAAIERAFVIVVGVGGVGSHAAHMLVRAGVRRIRVIDFDQVSLSSLNRHAVACRADVGTPKVTTLAKYFARIAPSCIVEPVQSIFEGARAAELLAGSPDFVLDCIDDIPTKAELLQFCHDHKLRVVSSLGAAGRADPTRVHI